MSNDATTTPPPPPATVATRAALLGNAAAPYEVRFGEKVYRVRRLDERAKSAFSAWLISRTRRIICDLYAEDAVQRDAELKRLNDEALAGEYEFEEDTAQAAVKTKKGTLQLAAILCGCEPGEVLAIMAHDAKRAELLSALDLVIHESFPGLKMQQQQG